ncbi:MAG: HPP family protein [Magnetococcales bacterium]|nr:HPP family protein [Magnetococcales bacterium]MBF0262448.1 HPP family protein [Magnetococcales bacterium]
MRGDLPAPARVGWVEIGWSWLGSFLGILLVAGLERLFLQESDLLLLIGSFGASAVLIYGAPASPLAQPRNLLLGHVVSALIGVAMVKLLPGETWLAAPLAVSLAIVAMHLTRSLHPPGGATALIAVIGSEQIRALGFWYALQPVLVGAILMLGVALLVNNFAPSRRYPLWW